MPILSHSPIEGELWKPIPGYGNRYEASSEGRLRVVKGKFCKDGRIYLLKTFVAKNGYVRTAVMLDGKVVKPGVHILIALAFLGPCPDGLEVDHVDRDKTNNKPCNLEYTTHKENLRRARAIKPWCPGVGNRPRAVLSDDQVRAILKDARPQRAIGAEYGISGVAVCNVRTRKTYRHVVV